MPQKVDMVQGWLDGLPLRNESLGSTPVACGLTQAPESCFLIGMEADGGSQHWASYTTARREPEPERA